VTIYLVIPLLVAVALLQTAVMPHLAIRGVFPDLALLVVVSWSLLRGIREGMIWGFIAGLAVDLFSGAPFGAATFSLMAVSFLSGLGQATVVRARFVLPLLAVFAATIIYDLLFLFVVWISGQPVAWLDSLVRIILPAAALNAVLTPIVFIALRKLHTLFGRAEMEW
jgi:rod shape-determining protein MreD